MSEVVLLAGRPPVTMAPWWWLVIAGAVLLALGLVVVGQWRWRLLGRVPRADDSLTRLRQDALAELAGAVASADPPRVVCQRISRITRRFVGTAGDCDVDFATAARVHAAARHDPRLEPLDAFVREIDPVCFDPAARPDPEVHAARAREVIEQWS